MVDDYSTVVVEVRRWRALFMINIHPPFLGCRVCWSTVCVLGVSVFSPRVDPVDDPP